jgi:hypothetical protein
MSDQLQNEKQSFECNCLAGELRKEDTHRQSIQFEVNVYHIYPN